MINAIRFYKLERWLCLKHIISSNSVVTKSIPRNAVFAGVPAKINSMKDDLGYVLGGIFDSEEMMPYLKFQKQ